MEQATQARVFAERPTEPIVRDAAMFAAPLLGLSLAAAWLGAAAAALVALGLAAFVALFFRNPRRAIPGDERTVVSPADGHVIDVGEAEREDGVKVPRVGIFLSVFDVHVNRSPVAGRVVAVERGGSRYRAAFERRAERENVRCSMTLETAQGETVQVVQIAGLVARRIVCHPRVGEWVRRGERYGLIRFGSRTDVVLPLGSEIAVRRGQRVRGGSSVLGTLPELDLPPGGAS